MPEPKITALYEAHLRLGAKIVDFASWLMPVQYTGIIEEHNSTRQGCGLFDIGHMGQIKTDDFDTLQRLTSNDLAKLKDNRAQYSFVLNEKGGILDDILVYRTGKEFLVIANASNAQKVFSHFCDSSKKFRLLYDSNTAVAIQGPKAASMVQRMTKTDISSFRHRDCGPMELLGVRVFASRSGYTGEDGFEFFFDRSYAERLWEGFLSEGAKACGLGARDSLRLEAGLPLYGHELDENTTPLEAGLSFAVDLGKSEFTGKKALEEQRASGINKTLSGFEVLDKAIARQGCVLFSEGKKIGSVTSGTFSPTLKKPLFMGYVEPGSLLPDGKVSVQIRGKLYPAKKVKLPFYRRCDKID